jgi:hypothetical protein
MHDQITARVCVEYFTIGQLTGEVSNQPCARSNPIRIVVSSLEGLSQWCP